jgi:DNA-binding transcriptional LysR family regulator
MIDLDLLRTFLAIYRTGSVTGASTQLAMSQPTATARLKALESTLKYHLFLREGRGVVPTAAAHELARSVGAYIDGLEAALAASRMTGNDLGGTVHIGGPAEFLSKRLLPSFGGLADRGIRLRVTQGLAQVLIEKLAHGDLDLAIATIRIRDDAIGYAKIYREEFVLVGSPQRAAEISRHTGRHFADVVSLQPVLAYAEDLPIVRRYWHDALGREAEFQAAIVMSDLRALVEAAAGGAGVTVVPRYLCEQELSEGRLVLLHKPAHAPGNDIFLAWNKFSLRHARNAFVRDLITTVAQGWR